MHPDALKIATDNVIESARRFADWGFDDCDDEVVVDWKTLQDNLETYDRVKRLLMPAEELITSSNTASKP